MTSTEPGPVALVGSGEYTVGMLEVERGLIAGRAPRYVQIPTAATREGPERLRYWVDLGRKQADRLGVEAVPLEVAERDQANDPEVAAQVKGAGLIYLSGGNPGLLADTLRDTALWRAIVEEWRAGAALAGCSAGAMAMADSMPDLRHPAGGSGSQQGLALLPHIRVLPHFDKMLGWVPDLLSRPFLRATAGVSLVGIDEDTAMVGGPHEFTVHGRQSVWLLGQGPRKEFRPGDVLTLRP